MSVFSIMCSTISTAISDLLSTGCLLFSTCSNSLGDGECVGGRCEVCSERVT